jgi:ADP-ribose pyrophosphatase YjhB (NUDIX family)
MVNKKAMQFDPHKVSQQLELNFCPRCAHALVDAEAFGRMRRVCPDCGLVVFREHKVAAGVLVTDDEGRVLLVQRAWDPAQGRWSLPAGFVDYDEAPEVAAVREGREETGLDIEVTELLAVLSGREHPHGADIVIVYRGYIVNGTLASGDDAADVAFFSLDALPPLAFRATREALKRYRAEVMA